MNILFHFFFPLIISATFFLLLMLFLRYKNFTKDGTRRTNWRNLSADILSSEIKYHNEAVYKAFEFYIKIVLAIFGAIGFASVSKGSDSQNIIVIIEYLGYATVAITLLFGFIFISHQKAKIERWQKRFAWYDSLTWNECWLFSMTVTIAWAVNHLLIPSLIKNILTAANCD